MNNQMYKISLNICKSDNAEIELDGLTTVQEFRDFIYQSYPQHFLKFQPHQIKILSLSKKTYFEQGTLQQFLGNLTTEKLEASGEYGHDTSQSIGIIQGISGSMSAQQLPPQFNQAVYQGVQYQQQQPVYQQPQQIFTSSQNIKIVLCYNGKETQMEIENDLTIEQLLVFFYDHEQIDGTVNAFYGSQNLSLTPDITLKQANIPTGAKIDLFPAVKSVYPYQAQQNVQYTDQNVQKIPQPNSFYENLQFQPQQPQYQQPQPQFQQQFQQPQPQNQQPLQFQQPPQQFPQPQNSNQLVKTHMQNFMPQAQPQQFQPNAGQFNKMPSQPQVAPQQQFGYQQFQQNPQNSVPNGSPLIQIAPQQQQIPSNQIFQPKSSNFQAPFQPQQPNPLVQLPNQPNIQQDQRITIHINIQDGPISRQFNENCSIHQTLEDIAQSVNKYLGISNDVATVDIYIGQTSYGGEKRMKTLHQLQLTKEDQTFDAKVRWIGGMI